MLYLYTTDNCCKCEELRKKYYAEGVYFEEREAERIKFPQDAIDQEALIQASMQNMELPVVVERDIA